MRRGPGGRQRARQLPHARRPALSLSACATCAYILPSPHPRAPPPPPPASPAGVDDDAESAGAPGASHAEEPQRELADLGMVLRDPPTFHLLLHHVRTCCCHQRAASLCRFPL
jgi:hypothetical protein